MRKVSTKDLVEALRANRRQMVKNSLNTPPPKEVVKNRGFNNSSVDKSYNYFLRKYSNLTSTTIDNFGTKDLVYYFREKAKEAGYKYFISSYSRDCGVMKKLLKDYTAMDICLMIEFMYSDEQDYLDKSSLAPTILISAWNNTIYQDSVSWANDVYIPHKQRGYKKKDNRPFREWTQDTNEIKIGEWN